MENQRYVKGHFPSQVYLTYIKINLKQQIRIVTSPLLINYVGDLPEGGRGQFRVGPPYLPGANGASLLQETLKIEDVCFGALLRISKIVWRTFYLTTCR